MSDDDLSFIPPKKQYRPRVDWRLEYHQLQEKLDDAMLNNRMLRDRVERLEKIVTKVSLGEPMQESDVLYARQLMEGKR